MLMESPNNRAWYAAPGISAEPAEDNLRYFKVLIFGPTSSPYEGKAATRPSMPS